MLSRFRLQRFLDLFQEVEWTDQHVHRHVCKTAIVRERKHVQSLYQKCNGCSLRMISISVVKTNSPSGKKASAFHTVVCNHIIYNESNYDNDHTNNDENSNNVYTHKTTATLLPCGYAYPILSCIPYHNQWRY